jgi:hypothetical protein
MEFITVECMNPRPHAAHSWREGFLWYRKRECGGVPKFRHRHFYKLHKDWSDIAVMTWCCTWPGCTKRYLMMRSAYQTQTLAHGWPWRK